MTEKRLQSLDVRIDVIGLNGDSARYHDVRPGYSYQQPARQGTFLSTMYPPSIQTFLVETTGIKKRSNKIITCTRLAFAPISWLGWKDP